MGAELRLGHLLACACTRSQGQRMPQKLSLPIIHTPLPLLFFSVLLRGSGIVLLCLEFLSSISFLVFPNPVIQGSQLGFASGGCLRRVRVFVWSNTDTTFSMESFSPGLHQMQLHDGNLKPGRLRAITLAFEHRPHAPKPSTQQASAELADQLKATSN